MTPDNWISIGSATATAILTGSGLYFGPKLAVRRALEQFRQQKIWERQDESYSRLIEALSRERYFLNNTLRHIQGQSSIAISDKHREEMNADRRTMEAVSHGYDVSPATAKAVTELLNTTDGEEGDDMVDDINSCIKAVDLAIKTAKRDAVNLLFPKT